MSSHLILAASSPQKKAKALDMKVVFLAVTDLIFRGKPDVVTFEWKMNASSPVCLGVNNNTVVDLP